MEQVIIEILQAVGIYPEIREKVNSDSELVELFRDRFGDLVAIMQNETASAVSSPGEAVTIKTGDY